MFKIVFLFFSFIQTNVIDRLEDFKLFKSFNNNVQENEEIIDQYKGYNVIKKENNYIIKGENFEITTQIFPSIIEYKETICITYIEENQIILLKYNKNGEYIESVIKEVEGISSIFSLHNFNNDIILVGGHKGKASFMDKEYDNNNILIYSVFKDELYFYGGLYDESYISSIIKDEALFIAYKKDRNSYGDFGNGGQFDKNIGICKINGDFKIEKNDVLNIDNLNNFNISDKGIIIYDNKNIYSFDLNYALVESKMIEENDKVYLGEDVIFINRNKDIILYDSYSLEEVYNEENVFNGTLQIFKKSINYKEAFNYYIDVIDFREYQSFNIYYNGIDNKDSLKTLFGKAKIETSNCLSYFDETTFGEYIFINSYKNENEIPFETEEKQEIKLYTNVCNEMVYPEGYRISSNGVMYLNGNLIINNTPIYEIGYHTLTIKGNGKETLIKFEIVDVIKEYNDKIYDSYDYSFVSKENCIIEYEINKEVNVKKIISNYLVNDFIIKSNGNSYVLYINFGEMSKGIHNIFIEKIIYEIDELEYEHRINKVFEILVKEKIPQISISNFDHEKVVFTIDSNNASLLRGFEFVSNNKNKKIIAGVNSNEQKINIENEFVECYLYYYDGRAYKYIKLCDMSLKEDVDELLIKTFINGNSVKLSFENSINKIKDIRANDIKIYSNQNEFEIKYVGYGLLCGLVCFFVVQVIRKKKKYRKE